jgi:hypothetical protein
LKSERKEHARIVARLLFYAPGQSSRVVGAPRVQISIDQRKL